MLIDVKTYRTLCNNAAYFKWKNNMRILFEDEKMFLN